MNLRPIPLGVALLALSPGVSEAHAFGVRYDLPLPLSFFLIASAAAVAVSFLVASMTGPQTGGVRVPIYLIIIEEPSRSPATRFLALGLRGLGVTLLLILLLAAFLGEQSPSKNLASVGVWVVWWVGFTLSTALLGNLWPLLDPWRNLHALLPLRRPRIAYPEWLQRWPAVFFLFAMLWMELIGDLAEQPHGLGRIILIYSLIVWLGMTIFGRDNWLKNVDPFERLFSLLGRFAPLSRFDMLPERPLVLRPPGAGLLDQPLRGSSDLAFVLLLLASVSYDGFTETPLWGAFLDWCSESQTLRPLLLWAQEGRLGALGLIESLGLLAAPLVFALVLFCFSSLASIFCGRAIGVWELMRGIAPSLLPIAVAYFLSHYLSYLLFAGQLAISLASDPFDLGWNLFGTRGRLIDLGVIGAKEVWYVSVVSIVVGHVIAVFLAHKEIEARIAQRRQQLLCEIPLVILMVAFTASSLWILSQPVILQ